MASADLIGVTAALFLEYVVGITLNIYILIVYIGNLKNGLSLGPSDMIHFTKALVNVSMQAPMISQNIFFWRHLFFINEVFLFFMFSNLFVVAYNSWLTALLCVYYCTNITTSSHRGLAWLKRSLSSYLLRILLLSGLFSVVICSTLFWFRSTEFVGNRSHQSIVIHGTFHQHNSYRFIPAILGFFLPLTIIFISTTLTAWSLINHIWRMKQNNTGSKLQTQINATRTMVLFLLSAIINNVVFYLYFTVKPKGSAVELFIIWIFFISLFISEAIIIIQSSMKLRKTVVKFLVRANSNRETET
ncbi:taste receptor type 2 member 4-like [Phyllobates terribilis]|uniref:taste receptor type 2 member 4-like n=1 Tax=Phyllobates terribilis TaxID=111132 RepID=UPI003CCA6F06